MLYAPWPEGPVAAAVVFFLLAQPVPMRRAEMSKGGTHKVESAAALDVGARSITLRGLCRRKQTSQHPAAVFGCQGAWGRAQRPARHKQEPWGFAGGRALQGRSTQPAVKDRRPTTERSDLERGMGRLAPCPSAAWRTFVVVRVE